MSPFISPISNENNMLCKENRRRSRSITQLDLVTDVNTDNVEIGECQNLYSGDLSGEYRVARYPSFQPNCTCSLKNAICFIFHQIIFMLLRITFFCHSMMLSEKKNYKFP